MTKLSVSRSSLIGGANLLSLSPVDVDMAALFDLQVLHKSHFIGETKFINTTQRSNPTFSKPSIKNFPTAKFKLYEMMGGRGLCYGEGGLQQELKKSVSKETSPPLPTMSSSSEEDDEVKQEATNISEDAFEKELLGLTGGFPGGEKGLDKFLKRKSTSQEEGILSRIGLIVIYKNPSNIMQITVVDEGS